jgi:hypothetical protein
MRSMIKAVVLFLAVAAGAAALSGCTSYYKVTDPTTGRVYYTTQLKQLDSGAVELTDAGTGGKVSLQNSSVQKINKDRYESGKSTSGEVPGAASAKSPS